MKTPFVPQTMDPDVIHHCEVLDRLVAAGKEGSEEADALKFALEEIEMNINWGEHYITEEDWDEYQDSQS